MSEPVFKVSENGKTACLDIDVVLDKESEAADFLGQAFFNRTIFRGELGAVYSPEGDKVRFTFLLEGKRLVKAKR